MSLSKENELICSVPQFCFIEGKKAGTLCICMPKELLIVQLKREGVQEIHMLSAIGSGVFSRLSLFLGLYGQFHCQLQLLLLKYESRTHLKFYRIGPPR